MIIPGCPEYKGNKRIRNRWKARRLKRFLYNSRGEAIELDKAGRMILHVETWEEFQKRWRKEHREDQHSGN